MDNKIIISGNRNRENKFSGIVNSASNLKTGKPDRKEFSISDSGILESFDLIFEVIPNLISPFQIPALISN